MIEGSLNIFFTWKEVPGGWEPASLQHNQITESPVTTLWGATCDSIEFSTSSQAWDSFAFAEKIIDWVEREELLYQFMLHKHRCEESSSQSQEGGGLND